MTLCVLAAGKTTVLAAAAFTLSWTHSVEKTRWEEDWHATSAGLELVAARVKGSGAGMEPPPEAVLAEGWWTWRPSLPPRAEIALAASGATGAGWSLCAGRECLLLGADAAAPIVISVCDAARE